MDLHDHCKNCYDMRCTVEPEYNSKITDGCAIVQCSNNCGMSLHECKLEEHLASTCANQIIPCINSLYGCPHEYPRYKTLSHLPCCPASVVTCKIEWNRWQRTTPVGQVEQPPSTPSLSTTLSSDILDVSLTARDQRVLEQSLKLPKRLRRSLRNSYTKNFPAVPLVQRSSAVEEGEDLEESTDSLDFFALEDKPCYHNPYAPPGYHTLPTPAVHCSLCKARKLNEDNGLASSITGALSQLRHNHECSNQTAQEAGVDSGLGSQELSDSENQVNRGGRNEMSVKVDMVTEMFNSFRSKPMKMLTFLCAQDFRRDQFSQHYNNIHSDIQAGLDGWFQVRCPLAVQGCQYTQQRFITNKNEKVVYNPVIESFCITQPEDITHADSVSNVDWLSNLPELVLLTLFEYMDSLSIKNLSLTSKAMRQRCEYLLRNNGMVILDWKKIDGHWDAVQKIWSFSSAFHEVKSWQFADIPSIGSHLKECPYNEKMDYTERRVLLHSMSAGTEALISSILGAKKQDS